MSKSKVLTVAFFVPEDEQIVRTDKSSRVHKSYGVKMGQTHFQTLRTIFERRLVRPDEQVP